jgi:hypothetical protein
MIFNDKRLDFAKKFLRDCDLNYLLLENYHSLSILKVRFAAKFKYVRSNQEGKKT